MVVILNENTSPTKLDGVRNTQLRSRHGNGWPLAGRRGADREHIQDTYHGKTLLQSTAVKRFQPSFPHTHVRVIVENGMCTLSEAKMAWGQHVLLYKIINACPTQRARAIPDVRPPIRTSLHRLSFFVHRTLWASFRVSVKHRPSSVAPLSPLADTGGSRSTAFQAPIHRARTDLYMRMSLAERDSLIKHHLARLPLYAHHLLGAYQDPHENTVLVLADMRQSSLACSPNQFIGAEAQVIITVLLPLLQHIAVLHSHTLAHHHLSPWHVFIPSEHARSLTCTLPCPAGHPDDINQLLADIVPAEFFAPETWSSNSDGQTQGGVAACKCDLWALGMILVCLLEGTTIFQARTYSSLVRCPLQHGKRSNSNSYRASAAHPPGHRSSLGRAVHTVRTVFPHVTSLIGGVSRINTQSSWQSSSADGPGDVDTSAGLRGWMGTDVHNQIQALVDQQLAIMRQHGISADLLALLRGLLEPDPVCRLSASDALAHPALRIFVRADADIALTEPKKSATALSAAPAVALQLWCVVRQSRQQLVEMSRRDTLMATLADRRDALDRLASLVSSTLGEQQPRAAMESASANPARQQDIMGATQGRDAVPDDVSALATNPAGSVTLQQRPRSSSGEARCGEDRAPSSALKWSGRVRFSGTGEFIDTKNHGHVAEHLRFAHHGEVAESGKRGHSQKGTTRV
eukprot:jgi/Ulvmu1/5419/UM022_0214.1